MLLRRTVLALLLPVLTTVLGGPSAGQTSDDTEDAVFRAMAEPWMGDLDGILDRGFIRVAVSFSPLFFVADGPESSGLTVDLMAAFEEHLRKTLGKAARNLTLVLAPLPRDRMLPALERGHVDLVAANLTVTPARQARVDFSDPFVTDIAELLVTGPAAPTFDGLDGLDAVEIHVRPTSSYHEHLAALDAERRAAGRPGLKIVAADENLEDEDILELVQVGVIPATIVDSHKAEIFAQVFEGLTVRDDIAVASGGTIAWAMRKGSPKLMDAANGFVKTAKKGTLLGNTLINRHFGDADRLRNALDDEEDRSRFEKAIGFIRTHAETYDFDALMIAAQGYTESRLDQKARSHVGAIGIMQVLPSTARDPAVGIPDISKPDANVEAGVKYLRVLRDTYVNDPAVSPRDQTLMAFAAYNAGPGNLRKARRRAEAMGLDPNVWFGNVELAMAKAVSREPVAYVRRILKYFVTYRLAEGRPETPAPPPRP